MGSSSVFTWLRGVLLSPKTSCSTREASFRIKKIAFIKDRKYIEIQIIKFFTIASPEQYYLVIKVRNRAVTIVGYIIVDDDLKDDKL